MPNKIIMVDSNMLLGIMRKMLDREEITLGQYAESLRRAKNARL